MSPANNKVIPYNLSALSVARVSGDDAGTFLQAQLSNDIQQLNPGQPHQLSAYCNPKGRVLALFHILKLDDTYLLLAPGAILDKVLARLKMFVMRAAVEITPDQDAELFGLQATAKISPQILTRLSPTQAHVFQHSLDPERFFMLGQPPLDEEALSNHEWNRLDILQQLPQVFLQTYEALIPQSLNLDIVGGVNFKKGCYPGQEIIARVKYRGKPKTRMISVSTAADASIEIGAAIYIEGRDRAAGLVLNVAHDNEETLLSISVPVTHILLGEIYIDEDRSRAVTRLPCPYEIAV